MTLIEEFSQCSDCWRSALQNEVERLERIDRWLLERERQKKVFPPRGLRLNALRQTPLNAVSVVICAQDPYPGVYRPDGSAISQPLAMGLAFSVPGNAPLTSSLKNIFKELGLPASTPGDLSAWAHSGVLLLNSILTLDQGKAHSHRSSEWSKFTSAVLAAVNSLPRQIVFLSWGVNAHKLTKTIDAQRHAVIKTSHPSNQGATKSGDDYIAFKGSGCFEEANELLLANGRPPIRWTEL